MEGSLWIISALIILYVYGCNAITLSTKEEWGTCKLANSTVFCNSDGECDANRVATGSSFTLGSGFSGPARINARVKWFKLIKDNGCRIFSRRTMETFTIEQNNILECTKKCQQYRFALQGNLCYCLSRSMRQADEKLCDAPCPGNPQERCGSLDGRYVSYFHQLPLNILSRGEDRSLPTVKLCGIYKADKLTFWPCDNLRPFFCYSEQTKKNVQGAAKSTWAEAVDWCRTQGLRLSNPGEIPSDMHRTTGCWVGNTEYHELEWDKGQDKIGDKCVALSKKDGKYQFETIECDSDTPGLCMEVPEEKTTTTTLAPSTKDDRTTFIAKTTTTRKPTTSKPSTTAKPTTTPHISTAKITESPAPVKLKTSPSMGQSTQPLVKPTTISPDPTSSAWKSTPVKVDTTSPPKEPVVDRKDDTVATGQLSETEKDSSSVVYIVAAVASILVVVAVIVIVILICRKRKRKEGAALDEENTPVKTEESSRLLASDGSDSSPTPNGKDISFSDSNGDANIAPKDTTPIDSDGYAHLMTNERRDDPTVDTYDNVTSNGGLADDTQNLLEKEQTGTANQQEADAEVYTSPNKKENNSTELNDSSNIETSSGVADDIKKENG